MNVSYGFVQSNAAWRSQQFRSESDWTHVIDPKQRHALVRVGERLAAAGVELSSSQTIRRYADQELGCLDPLMREVKECLRSGLGFCVLRDFPSPCMSLQCNRLAYAALGSRLGEPVPQTKAGELMCDIRDVGGDAGDPSVRLYKTRAEQSFHTDGSDLFGLLCLKAAVRGGVSRLVSSVSVYNEMLRRRPDLVPLLFETWNFHRAGEELAGAQPYFRLPIAQFSGDQLSTFFIGWYIRRASSIPGIPDLSGRQLEAIDTYEAIANDPELCLETRLRPGDVQWARNSVILHMRTAYEDSADPSERRHLLRLWLAAFDLDGVVTGARQGHTTTPG